VRIKFGQRPFKIREPQEMWIENAKYLKEKEKEKIDDAEWSLKRASRYIELVYELLNQNAKNSMRGTT
jgi:hypothetical protein